jgi:hypothetical protein
MKKSFILLISILLLSIVLLGCVTTGTTPGTVDTQQLLSDVIDLAIKVQANQSASIPTPIPPAPTPLPTPAPVPQPEPVPVPAPATVAVQLTVADMNTIPARMNAAGFACRPTLCWYALAQSFSGLDWDLSVAQKAGDTETLNLATRQSEIVAWWGKYLDTIKATLKSNPLAHAVVIVNDNKDSCGFRLGPATMDYLKDYSSQIELGTVITSW